MPKSLHIVSFDVPYPANYGGVIDIFYKVKALHELGIEIYLHTFEYGRGKADALLEYCKEVQYYPRKGFIKSYLSTAPFVVNTRANTKLIANLQKDDYPILFEGLHTTYPLFTKAIDIKRCYIRAHNIEHNYYEGLSQSETNPFKKTFFKQEAQKLKTYEKVVSLGQKIFTIAPYEQAYFKKHYGDKACYVPAFHDADVHTSLEKKGTILLYHGNLKVSENVKAAHFLISVYKDSRYPLTIASSFTNTSVEREISKHSNIRFQHIKQPKDLWQLFEKAHINVLPTFQKTGIKLKLLNTLYQGRFCLANRFMIEDTGLASICEEANTKEEFLEKTAQLFSRTFSPSEREERMIVLDGLNPKKGAEKIWSTMVKE